MRRIEDDFEVYEDFLGLYAVPSIDAVHLFFHYKRLHAEV